MGWYLRWRWRCAYGVVYLWCGVLRCVALCCVVSCRVVSSRVVSCLLCCCLSVVVCWIVIVALLKEHNRSWKGMFCAKKKQDLTSTAVQKKRFVIVHKLPRREMNSITRTYKFRKTSRPQKITVVALEKLHNKRSVIILTELVA